jgi:hypothetical protein
MAMETFLNLIGPVYSVNRYRIGAGKSRMLVPDFLAYGAPEAIITAANSLTRSLLRDQCVLPDGCVTAHASRRK